LFRRLPIVICTNIPIRTLIPTRCNNTPSSLISRTQCTPTNPILTNIPNSLNNLITGNTHISIPRTHIYHRTIMWGSITTIGTTTTSYTITTPVQVRPVLMELHRIPTAPALHQEYK
jgi:hypothetical protein